MSTRSSLEQGVQLSSPHSGKGHVFWLSFIAVVVCSVLSALDITAVSTALSTITHDLNVGDKFVWVGAAYGLAAAAIVPFTGRLADIFGRRPTMMGCVFAFFLGSALSGSAQNMDWLIAARSTSSFCTFSPLSHVNVCAAVQGIGGGGIFNLATIVISDLVPLAERGTYQGLLVLAWGIAAACGPIIGGAFAENATWRWLFCEFVLSPLLCVLSNISRRPDLNLPLCGIAFFLVMIYLRVRTPGGSVREKLLRIDLP